MPPQIGTVMCGNTGFPNSVKQHNVTAITPFKVIQGHRFWYQSKAHIRLPISDCLLSCTVSKLWLIIGQIFGSEMGVPHFNALDGVTPANIAINDISLKTRFLVVRFRCRKYWCIFNHFCVIRPEGYRILWNYTAVRAITPFKVIQGHRVWYQSKAHMRLPISD